MSNQHLHSTSAWAISHLGSEIDVWCGGPFKYLQFDELTMMHFAELWRFISVRCASTNKYAIKQVSKYT